MESSNKKNSSSPKSSSWADQVDAALPLDRRLGNQSVSHYVAQFETKATKAKKKPPKEENKTPTSQSKSEPKHQGSGKKETRNKGRKAGLSKSQQKMHRDFQNQAAQNNNILKSFFGDNQPTTGATELRFKMVDWLERPLAPAVTDKPILTYYLDVGRPFFADASAVAGEQNTRSKVRSVKLWFLSPPEALDSTPLLQILTAIPVKDEASGDALSLLGQSNTIIHPDVRQPWVMVGNWNWETIFENSQFQPFEYPATAVSGARDLLALFTYLVIDAVDGTPFTSTATGSANLKLEVELQAPIPLVPTPLRLVGNSAGFTSPPDEEQVSTDESPVQYSLKSIHRQM